MNNLGKPIPQENRQSAYDWLTSFLNNMSAIQLINLVSSHLENNKPYLVFRECENVIDLTASYRLIATLYDKRLRREISKEIYPY